MATEADLTWIKVAAAADVPAEDVIRAEIGSRAFALYNLGGTIYASDDCCTHQQARLSEGFVIDDIIECPMHQGRFHIPTGKAKGAPVNVALTTYPVKIVEGDVLVGLRDA